MAKAATVQAFNNSLRTWLGVMWSLVRIQSSRHNENETLYRRGFHHFREINLGSYVEWLNTVCSISFLTDDLLNTWK